MPEETTLRANKLNRSLTDLVQSAEGPSFAAIKQANPTHTPKHSTSSSELSDEEEEDEIKTLSLAYQSILIDAGEEDEHKFKHSASEPVIKMSQSKAAAASSITSDMDESDDDEMWCNPEDEANLKYRVKLDQAKEKQLREILGDETLEIVREALKVSIRDSHDLRHRIVSPFSE